MADFQASHDQIDGVRELFLKFLYPIGTGFHQVEDHPGDAYCRTKEKSQWKKAQGQQKGQEDKNDETEDGHDAGGPLKGQPSPRGVEQTQEPWIERNVLPPRLVPRTRAQDSVSFRGARLAPKERRARKPSFDRLIVRTARGSD